MLTHDKLSEPTFPPLIGNGPNLGGGEGSSDEPSDLEKQRRQKWTEVVVVFQQIVTFHGTDSFGAFLYVILPGGGVSRK